MNDVLKSLTVLDTNGGTISSISYDNNKPIDQRVAESSFNMSGGSFLSILTQLTGVEVSLSYEGKTIKGSIVSTAEVPTNEGKAFYISLWSGNSLKLLNLSKISDIEIDDATIRKQLQDAMNIQRESKIKGQKTLTINAAGKGKRQVNISYFIEAPVWKVSYRVVIPESSADTEEQNFVLQAWAIVDNITDEAWENVQLTLISGEPHCCEVDLVNPIFKKSRNEVQPGQYNAVYQQMSNRIPQQQQQQQQQMMNCIPQQSIGRNFLEPEIPQQETTSTKEIGDMFQYDVVNPVCVQKNESALVPIAEKKVSGSRVALYNPEKHSGHPNSAILLVNTTDLTLEGGPCAVIDSGTFVGESMMETVQRGEKKFIEFATEVSSDIWKTESSETRRHSSSIQNSQLQLVTKKRYITTYHLRNKSAKELSVYIEHRFRKDCKLVDTIEPTNPKPITFCIFKTTSPANETVTFVVTEEKLQISNIDMATMSRLTYHNLLSDGSLTDDASERIKSYLSLKEQAEELSRQSLQVQESIKKIFENHSRIRSNLSSLYNQGTGAHSLRDKYLAEMEADETKLSAMEDQVKCLDAQQQSLLSEAVSILRNITMN